jgi:hypothetical protein
MEILTTNISDAVLELLIDESRNPDISGFIAVRDSKLKQGSHATVPFTINRGSQEDITKEQILAAANKTFAENGYSLTADFIHLL